ncbi:MAG: nitrile hydratase accessory protein [Roseibium sp.]
MPDETPALPLGEDGGPVFAAPWQARVFAMTIEAHRAGLFTWSEWTEVLGAELAQESDGDPPDYYDSWLIAFEKLLTVKGIAAAGQLDRLKQAWDRAARATPHGKPIELKKG